MKCIVEGVPGRKFSEVVKHELEKIAAVSEGLDLLEWVQGKCVPIDTLLDSVPANSDQAYETARDLVSRGREKLTLNNFNDAINVAMVVCIYTQPTPPKGRPLMPVMFSQTRQITGLLENQAALSLPEKNRFAVFNEPHYLMVDCMLRKDGGTSIDGLMTRASVLSTDAQALARQHEDVLDAFKKGESHGMRLEWESLRDAQQRFELEWGGVLASDRRSTELDNVSLRNALSAPEVGELLQRLDARQPKRVRVGISRLVDHLQEQVQTNSRLISIFEDETPLIELHLPHADPITSLFKFSRLGCKQNDGRPLGVCDAFESLETIGTAEMVGQHDIRMVAQRKFVPKDGPFIAVDSWLNLEQSKTRWVGVTWQHQSDAAMLWKEGCKVLLKLQTKIPDVTDASCLIFWRDKEQENPMHLGDKDNGLDVIPDNLHKCDCFELHAGRLVFLADVSPLEGMEYQAGVLLPAECWSQLAIKTVISAMITTRSIQMAKEHYRGIINFLFQQIQIGSNPQV